MTGLMVISAWCLGILNTHRRFFLPYAAPGLWNIAGIVAMVTAGTWASHRAPPSVAPRPRRCPCPRCCSVSCSSPPRAGPLARCRRELRAAPNEQFRRRIAVGFRRIVYFVVPSSLAFIALNREIIGALYQTGRFTADVTALVGNVLAAYGVGLVGQATVKLFASGFYAMRDTRTPVKIAASSLVVSTGLAWLLMRWLGAPGIALGSSLGAFLNTALHLYDLSGRIGTVLRGPDWRALGIALLGAALAAAAGVGGAQLVTGLGPVPRGLLVLAIFGVVYGALTLALKHPDATRTWQSLTAFRAS